MTEISAFGTVVAWGTYQVSARVVLKGKYIIMDLSDAGLQSEEASAYYPVFYDFSAHDQ